MVFNVTYCLESHNPEAFAIIIDSLIHNKNNNEQIGSLASYRT